MHFSCRSFIGKHSDVFWSQYWENEPDNPLIFSKRGHLFGLIQVNSESADISSLGHDLISQIDESYFGNLEEENIESHFKETLNSVISKLNNCQVTFLIAVVFDSHLFVASFGLGTIILNRGHQVCRLLSGSEKEVNFISGPISAEDKILLITNSFLDKLTWPRIKTIISDVNIQSIEENFLADLYSFDDQSNLAAALIQIHLDEGDAIQNNSDTSNPAIQNVSVPLPPTASSSKISILKKIFSARKKSIYVTPHQINQVTKRKKINILIAVLLLLGLGVSSYFGYIKNKKAHAETQFQQYKNDLDKKLNDGFAIKNLNLDSALELGRQSQGIFQKISQLKIHEDELKPYQDKIKNLLSQTGSSENSSADFFYDTSLITSSPQFSKLIFKNNLLYLLDSVSGRIDSVNTSLKNINNISINEKIKSALDISENNGIYLTDKNGISLVSKTGVDSKINFSAVGSTAVNPVAVSAWNGAFYVLDSNNLTIWKYNPNASGFGSGEIWLKDNLKLSDKISSLAINGKIWVLLSDGQIIPFTRGTKENFKSAQTVNFSHAANLVTTIDSELLAFTDGDNLIYVYKKTGELVSKYNLGDKKIKSIAFDEKNNTLFILASDQKIYKITL